MIRPKLLTMNEVADVFDLPVSQARELGRQGVIPVVKVGRLVRVDPNALEEFIRQGGKPFPENKKSI